jgi:L-threonylcarbamoyladenylate synthase
MTAVVSLEDGVDEAVAALKAGGLVVHPTETVYGIGCALSAGGAGIARLRAAKGIEGDRPFLLVAADEDAAFALWRRVSHTAGALAEAYWPGALSLVAAARDGLPVGVLGGGEVPTIGVRVPAHEGLRRLLVALGEPMLSTSANPHGQEPSRVLPSDLLGADLALDEGPCPGGRPSTILSTLEDPPKVLREGPIPWPPPR